MSTSAVRMVYYTLLYLYYLVNKHEKYHQQTQTMGNISQIWQGYGLHPVNKLSILFVLRNWNRFQDRTWNRFLQIDYSISVLGRVISVWQLCEVAEMWGLNCLHFPWLMIKSSGLAVWKSMKTDPYCQRQKDCSTSVLCCYCDITSIVIFSRKDCCMMSTTC